MRFVKRYYILFACLFAFSISAQTRAWQKTTREEVLKDYALASKWIAGTPVCYLQIEYKSFANTADHVAFETAKGYFVKDKNNFHSYGLGIHNFQNTNYAWTVDSSNKIILVSAAQPDIKKNALNFEQFAEALKICKAFYKLTLVKAKVYRFEFPEEHTLEAYEITIQDNGSVQEVVLYYTADIETEELNTNALIQKPKLQMVFSNFSTTLPKGKDSFSEAPYFTLHNQKLQLQSTYKQYKLIDQRILK